MSEPTERTINDIVGATVNTIHWGEATITFDTDRGLISFEVLGDCCSTSYFHDIYGVTHLLNNGPVTNIEQINLQPGDPGHPSPAPYNDPDAQAVYNAIKPEEDQYGNVIAVYGYRLTTNHPQFGPVSTVIAFRNSSNGYYGGWMQAAQTPEILPFMRVITEDQHGD